MPQTLLSPPPGLLRIVQVVHYFQRPGRKLEGPATPPGHMLFELMTGGRGWYEGEDGTLHEVGHGDLLWHVPGERAISKGDWDNPYSCVAVTFATPPGYERRAARRTRWPETEQHPNLFAGVATRLWIEERGTQPTSVAAYLYGRLALAAETAYARQLDQEIRDELRIVLQYIDDHSDEPLRVKELARLVGWSVSHLIDQFKASLGMTPYSYIEARRFEKAKSILLSSNESISDIGRQVGLADAATFSRRFRSSVGCSPREFRNRARNPSNTA